MASLAACGGSEAADPASPRSTVGSAATSPTPTLALALASTPAPTESPQSQPLNQLISVAPDFTLPSANGPDVTLSELSADQPVVLVFYRAFW